MMRVAFLTNLIPPYHRPLYTLLSQKFNPFRLFISTPMEANRPWQPEWAGLDVVVQKGYTLGRRWQHPSGFGEALAVHFPTDTLQQLGRFKPDTVISGEMGFRTLLAYIYVKLHPGCRLLIWSEVTGVTEQGRGKARQIFRRLIARRVDGFLAVGKAGVRYIESLGVTPGRVFRIAYSTNLEPFLATPLERAFSTTRRLLFSGQLIERKGLVPFLEVLIRWARSHPESQIEWSLIGGGPTRQTLAAMPLPDNVKLLFIGTLQYDQLPGRYAAADIFVLPTLADTWAVVVNEAMASGLPVFGSIYSQAVAEMVEDGKSGWTFAPDEPKQMYAALERALATPEPELKEMRLQARAGAVKVMPEHAAAVCLTAVDRCAAMQPGR